MTKDEILTLLYRACCLYVDDCDITPDWIRIITGTNPDLLREMLEAAAEIACDDDTYVDIFWDDGL